METIGTILLYFALLLVLAVTVLLLALWLNNLAVLARRLVLLLLFSGIMAFWLNGIESISSKQEPGLALKQIEVAKGATDFALGASALVQNPQLPNSASEPHLAFSRGVNGQWRISNISAKRRLSLRYRVVDRVQSVSPSAEHHPGKSGGSTVQLKAQSGTEKVDEEKASFNASRFFLNSGDEVIGKGSLRSRLQINFDFVDHKSTRFRLGGKTYSLLHTGGRLMELTAPAALEACPEGLIGQGFRKIRSWLPYGKERVVALFGGKISCRKANLVYLAAPKVSFGSIALQFIPNLGFAIVSKTNNSIFVRRGAQVFSLKTLDHPVRLTFSDKKYQLESFIAGYTRYSVTLDPKERPEAGMLIAPMSGAHRLLKICDSKRLEQAGIQIGWVCKEVHSANEEWQFKAGFPHYEAEYKAREVFVYMVLFFVLSYFVVMSLAAILKHPIENSVVAFSRYLAFACGAGIIAGSAWLYLLAGNDLLSPRPPYFAYWAWATAGFFVFFAKGSSLTDGLLFLLWTAIVAFGHVAMMALSLEMEETRFLRFSDDTSLAIGISAGVLVCISQVSPAIIRATLQWFSRKRRSGKLPWLSFFLLGFLILALWVVWILFGSETGIAGYVQPSEAIKTLFAVAMGVLLTFALDRQRAKGHSLRKTGYWETNPESGKQSITILMVSVTAALVVWLFLQQTWLSVLAGLLTLIASFVLTNPFWRGFALIALLVGVMLGAPVSRSDMSPILIIVFTTLLTFAISSLMHVLAIWNNHAVFSSGGLWHVGRIPVRRRIPHPWYYRISLWFNRQLRYRWPVLTLPYPWLILLPAVLVFSMFYWSGQYLQNADQTKEQLINNLGSYSGFLDVPIKRSISWVEFNAVPSSPGEILAVEFADTARQVDLSRKAIAASACNIWGSPQAAVGKPDFSTGENGMRGWLAVPLAESTAFLDTGVRWIKRAMLGRDCNLKADNTVSVEIAKRIFAIQSDFVSTWLIAYFGRDGAMVIAILQLALVAGMLLASFLILQWHPGISEERPAANMAAFAVAAFAIMIALQWTISWANAFGGVPVMGQPSTFLSHGRSHFLYFGLPAMAFVLSALRMRAAFSESRGLWRIQKTCRTPLMPQSVSFVIFAKKWLRRQK